MAEEKEASRQGRVAYLHATEHSATVIYAIKNKGLGKSMGSIPLYCGTATYFGRQSAYTRSTHGGVSSIRVTHDSQRLSI